MAASVNHLGLQKLLSEPARLLDEAGKVDVELETLITSNYKVFVENLTCSVHLQNQVRFCFFVFFCLNNAFNSL